eukprot:9494696-Pyramimonas_sp.AAC.1
MWDHVRGSTPLHCFDSCDRHIDHVPVQAHLARTAQGRSKRGTEPLDREKMKDPQAQDKFRALLRAVHVPPWTHNIHDQVKQLTDHANAFAIECFAVEALRPKKPY